MKHLEQTTYIYDLVSKKLLKHCSLQLHDLTRRHLEILKQDGLQGETRTLAKVD